MNAATFRIVHFVPDPFLGGRVPIAAVVESDGKLTVVRVPHLPGPACLGRASAAAAMRLALEDLERLRSFEHLPASMGPQVVLGEVREVPLHVDDPVGWVGRALSGGRDPHAHATQNHDWARGARGMQLMRAHHLDRYVHRKFRPGRDGALWRGKAPELGPITQYVPGKQELMLMEPIVPARSAWRDDLTLVTERFSAYQFAIERGDRPEVPARFYAYILAGGPSDRRAEIRDKLAAAAERVVDTAVQEELIPFLDHIRATGENALFS